MKENKLDISLKMLPHDELEGDKFLNDIATQAETWVQNINDLLKTWKPQRSSVTRIATGKQKG